MARRLSYADHQETLIALVMHLATTDWSMRTPPNLAKALSIDEAEIQFCLDSFKGLFRRSQKTSKKTSTNLYTLQLRYARQWLEEQPAGEDEEPQKPPLDREYVTALLDFVIRKAAEERTHSVGFVTAWIAAGASLVVAIIAIIFSGR